MVGYDLNSFENKKRMKKLKIFSQKKEKKICNYLEDLPNKGQVKICDGQTIITKFVEK
jgi:hypothetical protein